MSKGGDTTAVSGPGHCCCQPHPGSHPLDLPVPSPWTRAVALGRLSFPSPRLGSGFLVTGLWGLAGAEAACTPLRALP